MIMLVFFYWFFSFIHLFLIYYFNLFIYPFIYFQFLAWLDPFLALVQADALGAFNYFLSYLFFLNLIFFFISNLISYTNRTRPH